MKTRDLFVPKDRRNQVDKGHQLISRSEWIDQMMSSSLWKALEEQDDHLLRNTSFSKSIQGIPNSTDLNEPLEKALNEKDPLKAIIMLSDGDSNAGKSPIESSQKLRARGIPIFTVPLGNEEYLPDIELSQVNTPSYVMVGEQVQIPFSIRSSLPYTVSTSVELRDDKGHIFTKSIVLAPHQETHDSIIWKLKEEGVVNLHLSVPIQNNELLEENNSRTFPIIGRVSKIKVLIIETLPRWEYRFLRNALSRDPHVELSCLLFHPDLGLGKGKDYISKFPHTLDELASFDVVILGDVGIDKNQLTTEQCAKLRGLVENQASGLVFLPGRQGNQFSLLDTALSDLIPVTFDHTQRQGLTEAHATPLHLSHEGQTSLLTMLGNSAEENSEIWRSLPGFYWHAPINRAKAGSEVIAVHSTKRNSFGAIPLMVTQSAGNGKVLFMGIDSAWRWRRGVEDLYHYRFWGQVARWMSYRRNMATGERVRLFYSPENPHPHSTIHLSANAFDTNGSPLTDPHITVDILSPKGAAQRIELRKNDSEWGSYSGMFRADSPGKWELEARVAGAPDFPTQTQIHVQDMTLEKTGRPANLSILREIAEVSGGKMIHPDELPQLIKSIKNLPSPRSLTKRIPIWSHTLSLLIPILLLAVYWIARKWHHSI